MNQAELNVQVASSAWGDALFSLYETLCAADAKRTELLDAVEAFKAVCIQERSDWQNWHIAKDVDEDGLYDIWEASEQEMYLAARRVRELQREVDSCFARLCAKVVLEQRPHQEFYASIDNLLTANDMNIEFRDKPEEDS